MCEVNIMDNSLSQYLNGDLPGGGILTELYEGTLMSENSVDYIIPDYVSDADKILLCTAMPKIEGKFINGNTVELEGTVYFYLLLSTEGNTLSSLSYSEPFEAKAVVNDISDECFVSLTPAMEYTNARLVNPRKVNLRYQVNTGMRVFCIVTPEPEISGTETIDDDMNLQRRREILRTADTVSAEEKNIPVSQDIELDSSYPQAEEIILCRIRLQPNEIRMQENQIDIQTDASVNCIYRTDEGNYFCAEKKFTLDKNLTGTGDATYEWMARAVPEPVTAKISANSYGEMKIIELDFAYDLELTGIKNRETEAVCDMYSTEFECDTSFTEKDITVFRRCFASNLSVNASVPRTDINSEKVKSVFTGAVNIKKVSAQYNKDKNKLVTEGTAEILLVCENNILVENEELFSTAAFEYPFKCETEAPDDLTTADFIVECTVGDTRFRADSQNIYSDFELSVKVLALDSANVRYLSAVKLNKDAPVSHNSAPITLSYPSGKETLWDIAKYYKITGESIMASNGMANEDISEKKVLLIPRSSQKKSLFSKVI